MEVLHLPPNDFETRDLAAETMGCYCYRWMLSCHLRVIKGLSYTGSCSIRHNQITGKVVLVRKNKTLHIPALKTWSGFEETGDELLFDEVYNLITSYT